MEAVNNFERQPGINHSQEHITDSGNSHWTSKDSGNGSQDVNDVDILQNGGTDAHLSVENELSEDGEMKHRLNTSSCRAACNGKGQEMMPYISFSSNCSGSLSSVKSTATRIERQNCVDMENIDCFLQTPTVISSCQNGHSDTEGAGFKVHSTDNFKSTPGRIQCHENASEKHQDIKLNHSRVSVGDSQGINVNHSHVVDSNNTKVNHVHKDIKESGNINVNHSHLAIKDNHSMNHQHVPEEENDRKSIEGLIHHSLSEASLSELLNKFYEDSNISAAGLHRDHISRCLSAPSPSANMSHQPPEFMSLPVSPVDLVPKHIMDSLGRELHRERCKVNVLQEYNQQLCMKVMELEGKYRQCQERFNYCLNELKLHNQKVATVKQFADSWQAKCYAKDNELSAAHQYINDLSERCKHLGDQIIALNRDLQEEKNTNRRLNDSIYNVNRILKNERDRFNRDDKCSKERTEELKHTNQWLKEQLAAATGYPMSVSPKHNSPPRLSHTEIEADDSQSHVTQLKGVYPENTVFQETVTLRKQTPTKCAYKTQESCNTSPKVNYTQACSEENTSPDGEKCGFCYKLASEFQSSKEFREHVDKCGN